jgi:hypothetical protein
VRSLVCLLSLASLVAVAGCSGNIGTSQTGDQPSDPVPSGDDDDDGTTPATPAQLAITRFEVAAAATSTDDYEPNDTTPFYLGGYGYEYTIDDATIAPTELVYTVEVTNTGAPVTAPFNVDFFRNAAAAPMNQLGDVRQEIPALDTGASAEITFQVTDADPGTPMSWAVADASDLVDETDETDNVSAGVSTSVALDVDVFSVYQTANYPLNIRLDQLPADYDLELVSPGGTVLARGQNDGLAAESLNGTVTQTGTYMIRVYGFGTARSAQPYRLVITVP